LLLSPCVLFPLCSNRSALTFSFLHCLLPWFSIVYCLFLPFLSFLVVTVAHNLRLLQLGPLTFFIAIRILLHESRVPNDASRSFCPAQENIPPCSTLCHLPPLFSMFISSRLLGDHPPFFSQERPSLSISYHFVTSTRRSLRPGPNEKEPVPPFAGRSFFFFFFDFFFFF